MFQTKPNQTVLFLFPNLSKNSLPESIFQFLINYQSITGAKTSFLNQ